ncbi:MAG: phenylacetate-CoA oxygenase subunit PaaJ [Flavobacteriales bacterium]|nr:phenylacetate-CoA oxygenase subunit PaaJ [Flavobacteriales bacterium]
MEHVADIPSRFIPLLDQVADPEIPLLTVRDMGVVRKVEEADDHITITITPTYSGCPAMDTIEKDLLHVFRNNGYPNTEVKTILYPPWTTDWFSEEAREKLVQSGISPPDHALSKAEMLGKDVHATCPRCKSQNTQRISEFGSTACKALYKCLDCGDPFDYFKCI